MKNLSRPQYHRIRRMLELIRAGTRSGHYPNASQFGREFQVVRRTVLRDLDFLKEDEKAPIAYDSSRKGYYLTDASWSLPSMQVTRQEVFAFSIARKLLQQFKGTPLELDMKAVLEKIGRSVEGQVTLDAAALTEHFTVLHEDYVVQDPAVWQAVAGCLERRERLAVRYRKFNGEENDYILEPLHLLAYHGNWYVLAVAERGAGQRNERPATFALSRIRSLKRTGALFAAPGGFDLKEHLGAFFGGVRGEEVMDVRLLFSREVATYIRERVWHASQKLVDRKDGSVDVCLRTAGARLRTRVLRRGDSARAESEELVRWVLSWQPDVQVLAPARLRERVMEKLRQGLGKKG